MKKFQLIAAAALLSVAAASFAGVPYAVDQFNKDVVMDPYGLCWRSGSWTPAAAQEAAKAVQCKCDREIVPASACEAAPAKAAAGSDQVTFAADLLFDFAKSNLKPAGQKMLDDLVARMAGIELSSVVSTGYTDRIGGDEANIRLSQRRAQAVKAYLVKKGVAADVITTEGRGEADPVVDCPKETGAALIKCLQPNRRAVVEVNGTRKAM